MQMKCPNCVVKIAFPNEAQTVLCPSCNQTFNSKDFAVIKNHGWYVAAVGLLLMLSVFITMPIVDRFDASTSLSIGLLIMQTGGGIIVALTGLIMSISAKIQRRSPWIILELILGSYLIFGLLSLTQINGIV